MDTDETNKSDYPHFISNKPRGEDKCEGKSQEKLANAIVKHIIDIDAKFPEDKESGNDEKSSRIIGLEGGWGAGKSNVIKQLPDFFHIALSESKDLKKNKSKYYIFEYDAWGHQEDLQRRSFLETLTAELIDETVLTGKTEISIFKNGKEEKREVEWKEKLNYLLARKRELISENIPKLSPSLFALIFITITTPIFISIASTIKEHHHLRSTFMPIIPLCIAIIGLTYYFLKQKKEWKNIINELLSVYSGKVNNEVTYETISEKEPSVEDFRKWMLDISKHLKLEDKKLIIVYDNMDRLPAEKVKELWSSIHTFFAEEGFSNIWTIIPFDEKHLACAFGEKSEEKTTVVKKENIENSKIDERKQLTKYFISKTFPVVYRVTPPVTTDYKDIFNYYFEKAFGKTEVLWQDNINRIFRLEKPDATIRDIIEFINQLVALKNIWVDEIDIIYMAVFVLKKDKLFENAKVDEQILDGKYLGDYIPKFVSIDEELQTNISALVYGVPLDMAEQIPMTKHIESCFNLEPNTDINKFVKSKNFISILDEKIKNADSAQTDNIVKSLSTLNVETFNASDKIKITSLWDELAKNNGQYKLNKQEFNSTYKELFLHTSQYVKEVNLNKLSRRIQYFEEDKFSGKDYYTSLNEIKEFLEKNKIDLNLFSKLKERNMNAKIFIDYVIAAKENYKLFKLSTNPQKLDDYLTSHSPAPDNGTWKQYNEVEGIKGLTDYEHILITSTLSTLAGDENYKFDKFLNHIKENIPNANATNFKQYFDIYKILSPDEKPFEKQLDSTQRQTIWNAFATKPNTSEYLEIVTIQIANGQNTGGTFKQEQIIYIAENINFYADIETLLISNLTWNNIPILNQVLKYIIENQKLENIPLKPILSHFFDITSKYNVTESALLKQLDNSKVSRTSIDLTNIQTVLPNAKFFQFSKATKNPLTDYLNKTIVEKLSTIQADQLFQFRKQDSNNYWIVVMNNLIDSDFLKTLPDNLTELGKKYLDEIAAGSITPVPTINDLVYKLIAKLDRTKTPANIKDIRDKFCISQYNMTPPLFLFFENWFENQGELEKVADRATHKIIEPVINDANCLNKITSKSDYYAKIINAAGNDATAVKDNIKGKLKNSTDPNLIAFAEKIGIEKEKQEKETK